MSNNFYNAIISYGSVYPNDKNDGMLFFNTSDNTLNIYINGKWFNITNNFHNYLKRHVTTYNNLINNIQNSYTNNHNNLNTYINEYENVLSNYNNLFSKYQDLANSQSSFLNSYNMVSYTYNTGLNNLLNNLESNFVYASSIFFQALTGFYIYNFNFSNLYNSYMSGFTENFNVFSVVRRCIDYYFQGGKTTEYLSTTGENYPFMYHIESELVYSTSTQNGSLSILIGPTSHGHDTVSSFSIFGYSQDSSAELYEVKFFAGPFNTSQQVTSNLNSDGYISQSYGTTSHPASYSSSSTINTFNVFGYNFTIAFTPSGST